MFAFEEVAKDVLLPLTIKSVVGSSVVAG